MGVCSGAYVGKKEADKEKGWVMTETCLEVRVMEKVVVWGEGWVLVTIMMESSQKNPWKNL